MGGLLLFNAAHAQVILPPLPLPLPPLPPLPPGPAAVPGEFIVKYRKPVDELSITDMQRLKSEGVVRIDILPLVNAVVVQGSAEQNSIEATQAAAENPAARLGPDVEYVEANYLWQARPVEHRRDGEGDDDQCGDAIQHGSEGRSWQLLG